MLNIAEVLSDTEDRYDFTMDSPLGLVRFIVSVVFGDLIGGHAFLTGHEVDGFVPEAAFLANTDVRKVAEVTGASRPTWAIASEMERAVREEIETRMDGSAYRSDVAAWLVAEQDYRDAYDAAHGPEWEAEIDAEWDAAEFEPTEEELWVAEARAREARAERHAPDYEPLPF